jgi:hypothetical protein
VVARAHRERQASKGFARIRPDALVFQTINGKPLHRRTLSVLFRTPPTRRA